MIKSALKNDSITLSEKVNRNYGLDLMRAIAIVLVVLNHSLGILDPLTGIAYIGNYIGKGFALFQPVGMLGVEMFFVLSGFLIGRILILEVIKYEHINFRLLLHFWIRRWMRTLPAYWLVVTILFLLNGIWMPGYYFFLQSISSERIHFFVESWSLPVEEFFYLLFPIFLIPFSNGFRGITISKKILLAIIFFILFFTLVRIFTIIGYDFTLHEHIQIRMMTFLRLDSIGFGVLMAWWNIFFQSNFARYSKKLFKAGLVSIILFTGINYLGTHPYFLWYEKYFVYKRLTDLFFYSILPISFALLLPLINSISFAPKSNFSKFVIHTSKISYSLYLVHLGLLRDLLINPMLNGGRWNAIMLFGVYILLCFSISTLMYRYFELPIMNLRDRLSFIYIRKEFSK